MKLPSAWKQTAIKSSLQTLNALGIFRLLQRNWQGIGVIFTLHHVDPVTLRGFSPNRILSITPDYLREAIREVRSMGTEFVSLQEGCDRLRSGKHGKRFACLTFDDGYIDNLHHALPVLEAEDVPFALYVSTAMPNGTAMLWWDVLELVIEKNNVTELPLETGCQRLPTRSASEKSQAHHQAYRYLRGSVFTKQHALSRELAERCDFNWQAHTSSVALDWPNLQTLADHPLCEIGAHTVDHPALSLLDDHQAGQQIEASRAELSKRLNVPIRHFAYPYGDPGSAGRREFDLLDSLGFESSVTTRKGVLFPEHRGEMQALPRVSLNGDFQSRRYTRIFAAGAPFALSNRFHRLNVN